MDTNEYEFLQEVRGILTTAHNQNLVLFGNDVSQRFLELTQRITIAQARILIAQRQISLIPELIIVRVQKVGKKGR
ncbi:hypothetical protein LC087_02640 [Bacillus carboniphilus]|uniref:Uncharacterized protein n=1 Tax=Bacillus carboniphilus TaxID=86663 RepID=A0ABY9JWE7_9BACI|nr:hypothetical protein [Bacillus carboniphilus]WLR43124.1 hypothetical protein LC087_02640 [Bacillus carboniphilus]